MTRPLRALLLLPVLLLPGGSEAQEEVRATDRARRIDTGAGLVLERGPESHLGWGTAEDLFVPLGGGAAVSVLSGNLVLEVVPFPRGDAIPGARMALTYNHRDPDGHPALAVGWTWDLGRRLAPGPWGDRILVDGDGFRDSFRPEGAPMPSGRDLERIVDDIVAAWRRQTPLGERGRFGGAPALRAQLRSDPLLLGELRLQWLGPPEQEDPDAPFFSQRRGARSMVSDDDGGFELRTEDGGSEGYDEDGRLLWAQGPGRPRTEVVRRNGRLERIDVSGGRLFTLDTDSRGRIAAVKEVAGRSAELVHADRRLHRLRTPVGSWRFEYDRAGRLTRADGPDGILVVEYDEATGAVRRAAGPERGVILRLDAGRAGGRSARVERSDGQPITVEWDPGRRERRVEGEGWKQLVRYEEDRPLPLLVQDERGRLELSWHESGRLESAKRGGVEARWDRGAGGRVIALQEPGGASGSVVTDASGRVLSYSDPAGRRTALDLDQSGLPRAVHRPSGLTEGLRRGSTGALLGFDLSDSADRQVNRGAAGRPWTVQVPGLGSTGLRHDERGRLVRLESSTDAGLRLDYGPADRVRTLSDGRSSAVLDFDTEGRLTGWSVGGRSTRLRRDDRGAVTRVNGSAGELLEVARGPDGRPRALSTFGGSRRSVDLDADGVPLRWARRRGGELRFERDEAGRVTGREDDANGPLGLERDRSGRVTAVRRGVGSWTVGRDASGVVSGLRDPSGGFADLGLDPGGRPDRVVLSGEQRWSLLHDRAGRLRAATGASGTWELRRRPFGAVDELRDPTGRSVQLDRDRAGRWRKAVLPGGAEVVAQYSELGPTRVGETALRWESDGSLRGFDRDGERGAWTYARDADGLVRAVAYGRRLGAPEELPEGEAQRVVLERGPAGRVLRVGELALQWGRGGVLELSGEGPARTIDRDAAGRPRTWQEGSLALELLRERTGDLRELTVSAAGQERGAWRLYRDSAGRVVEAARRGGASWKIGRDLLGRPSGWTFGLPEEEALVADWVYDAETRTRSLSVHAPGGLRLLSFEERLDRLGRPLGARISRPEQHGPRPATDPIADALSDLPLGPAPAPEASLDPIGDRIEALEAELEAGSPGDPPATAPEPRPPGPGWAELVLRDEDGAAALPSPEGHGTALTDDDRLRAHDGRGEPLGALGPFGEDLPAGEARHAPVALRADEASAVGGWWDGHAPDAVLPASLPGGVCADPEAWIEPRRARFAAGSRLGREEAVAGAGALLLPIPGAGRLVPGSPGTRRIDPLQALVLSGDLPFDAVAHRAGRSTPTAAWTVEVPGADLLLDLARRRSFPSLPPFLDPAGSGGPASGSGLLTGRGAAFRSDAAYEVDPAVLGLPPGTPDLVPGRLRRVAVAHVAGPIDARSTALEALSDEPLGTPGVRAALAEDDSDLLLLRALTPAPPSAFSGLLAGPEAPECWRIDLPSGVAMTVDGRGRLLSVDAATRLTSAWDGAAVAAAAALLLDGPGSARLPGEEGPPGLPDLTDRPETAWGLLPASPDFPVDGRGVPAAPRLRALPPGESSGADL